MNNKSLLITTVVFFFLINTSYYWESMLGVWAMPATLILGGVYIGLLTALFRQLFFAIKERFNDRQRLVLIAVLTTVIVVTFFRPLGFIDFSILEGDDILIARSEGAANCMTTLKLKENNKFTEKNVCFGVREIKGTYKLINDTIYFENGSLGGREYEFYKFAVIRPSGYNNVSKEFDLVRYISLTDTTGHELSIVKNELNNSTLIKPDR